ncbi:endoplasmic reticulum resident protein 27 [Mantella aurantiaca]
MARYRRIAKSISVDSLRSTDSKETRGNNVSGSFEALVSTSLCNESLLEATSNEQPPPGTMGRRTMSCTTYLLVLVSLLKTSLCTDDGNSTSIEGIIRTLPGNISKDSAGCFPAESRGCNSNEVSFWLDSISFPERKAIILPDVPSAKAFISSTDIAVVGFFTDLEEPEIEHFDTLVKNHPEWDYGTSTAPEVLKHYKINSNTITIFRKADKWRDDLVVKENEGINTAKLYRFLTINELRLVAEYNPMTAIGLIASKVQVHLLFFTDSDVQDEAEIMKELREAANDLRGKVLFVKLDVGKRYTQKIAGFFKLQKSDLPLLSIYDTESNKKLVLPRGEEITAQRVKEFCLKFLSGDYTEEELENNREKIEL